jgi:hypothetical protein
MFAAVVQAAAIVGSPQSGAQTIFGLSGVIRLVSQWRTIGAEGQSAARKLHNILRSLSTASGIDGRPGMAVACSMLKSQRNMPLPKPVISGRTRRNGLLLPCLVLLLAAVALEAQPTVSGITVDLLSHSDARITWTATGCDQNAQRIRYGFTSAYERRAGGGIQGGAGPGLVANRNQVRFGLSGLLPNTLYHFSAESSCDNGVTWSTPIDQTFTTLPLPSPHPALPAGPPVYRATFPDTTGYKAVTISSSCAGTGLSNELQIAISNAVALQQSNGTVITIPAGTVCSGTFFFPQDTNSAIKTFTVSGSTLTSTAHGYSDGQAVMISAQTFGGYPIRTGSGYGVLPGPLVIGEIYYVTNAGTDMLQLSLTPGGPPVELLDAGSGGPIYVTQWPPYNRNAIVIQTSTPDTEFTPQDVRTSPAWQPKMATIQMTGLGSPSSLSPNVAITTNQFTHDIWFRGIEITHPDISALANSSNDPAPIAGFIATTPDSSYVTFDRCYIHGLGAPNRIKYWLAPWAGHYATIQNSYMENLVYPRSISLPPLGSGSPGLTPSIAGGVLTVGAGSLKLMKGTTCATSGLTWTNTGGSSTSHGYLEVALDCTPTLILPADATASCTGGFNDGATDHACAVITQASPAFTLDGSGANARQNFTVADFPIAGGVWGNVTDDRGQVSVYNSEGTQLAYAGMGRGPYYLINNYSSGTGNIWHMDDQSAGGLGANTALTPPSGYLWKRNTFDMPLSTIPGSQWSDGYEYGQRENTEWKTGTRILMTGNIFQAGQGDISPYGCAALWSSVSSTISDVEISYNTFRNIPCAFVFISVPGPNHKGSPINRVYIHDNISENMNAYTFLSQVYSPNHTGIWLTHGYLMEDMIVDHNTVVDARGTTPDMFHLILTPQEGTKITNNIFWGNDDGGHHGWSQESGHVNWPSCGGIAKIGMDCLFVQGAGNTLYNFQQNLFVPQFANSKNLTGDAGVSNWQAAYKGLPGAIIQTGSTPADRAQGVGFRSFKYGSTMESGNDYHLTSRSAYCATCGTPATDGRDLGADVDALLAAQGYIGNLQARSVGNTGFVAAFHQSDAGAACTVVYGPAGTSPAAMKGRVIDSCKSTDRAVSVTGLANRTTYDWYAACANATMVQGPRFTTH